MKIIKKNKYILSIIISIYISLVVVLKFQDRKYFSTKMCELVALIALIYQIEMVMMVDCEADMMIIRWLRWHRYDDNKMVEMVDQIWDGRWWDRLWDR